MFVRAANPIWYMVDHVGQPLNDEYYAFFLTNTLPYLPQSVYRDPQGITIWTGDIVQFQPSGTLPDNLYFDPTLVYRIEIRHGNSQSDELVWEINNFVPGESESVENELSSFPEGNMIANSRFSHINFGQNQKITEPGTYNIAPGYDLVLTGSGTTFLNQFTFTGSDASDPQPPLPNTGVTYYIEINNTGWSTAILRQRFENNGWIWRYGSVAVSLTARAQGSQESVTISWVPSNSVGPNSGVDIVTKVLGIGDFEIVEGVVNLDNTNTSDNPDSATDAYVDMVITLPVNGTVQLTNFQVIGQTNPLTNVSTAPIPPYQQEPEERILDHLYHYYYDISSVKPKKSLLVGWNFPLNPYQFIDPTLVTQTGPVSYIADQTILYQEAASQLQSGQGSSQERLNLEIKAVTAATTTRFALIQYIDQATIKPYWSYILSSLVRARIFTTANSTVHLKARLIWRTTAPPSISATEPISSWPANSDPVFSADWTAIVPENDPAYVLQNSYATDETTDGTEYPAYPYIGFQLPVPPDMSDVSTMYLGIVIYTMENLHSVMSEEDSINFDRISLIPAKTAGDALPQTFDECLEECQYYYEKSYENQTLPGTTTFTGAKFSKATLYDNLGVNHRAYISTFDFTYQTIKANFSVSVFLYNPNTGGVINTIYLDYAANGVVVGGPIAVPIANFNATISTKNAFYVPNTNTNTLDAARLEEDEPRMFYHYVVDARLGRP